jgi:hypothetical protein
MPTLEETLKRLAITFTVSDIMIPETVGQASIGLSAQITVSFGGYRPVQRGYRPAGFPQTIAH